MSVIKTEPSSNRYDEIIYVNKNNFSNKIMFNILTISSYVFSVIVMICVLVFIIVHFNNDIDVCNIKCLNEGSIVKDDDGNCLCDCPWPYTGDTCNALIKGYTEGFARRCSECKNEHKKYVKKECTFDRDTLCGKCGDGYFASSDKCEKCTDCEADGKLFQTKCLNNVDSKCMADKGCSIGEFWNVSNKECQKHTDCSLYKSKGTPSYDAVCATSCFEDEYRATEGDKVVCRKCRVCDETTEIETSICGYDNDRECTQCPNSQYVNAEGKCTTSSCPSYAYNMASPDGGFCVRCTKCDGEYNIYERACGVANNAICNSECPQGDYYLDDGGDDTYVCEKCTSCRDDEVEVSPCRKWEQGDEKTGTSDTVCVGLGPVSSDYAASVCSEAGCNIGGMNPDYKYNPTKAYKKCQGRKSCSIKNDCERGDGYTGECDGDGFCELFPTIYFDEEGSCEKRLMEIGIADPTRVTSGNPSTIPSSYYKECNEDTNECFAINIPASMLPKGVSQAVKKKIKVKLSDGSIYESKKEYDWGDSCYVDPTDRSRSCILNITYDKEFRDMVCKVGGDEYRLDVCATMDSKQGFQNTFPIIKS
jgi:hypothetical protein